MHNTNGNYGMHVYVCIYTYMFIHIHRNIYIFFTQKNKQNYLIYENTYIIYIYMKKK